MAGAAPLNTDARAGVIFFAHGSRDPLWRQPIEAVAQALKARYPHALCACAYLELTEPDLATAAQGLIAQGCTHITILPMFLGTGRMHAMTCPCWLMACASSTLPWSSRSLPPWVKTPVLPNCWQSLPHNTLHKIGNL